MENILYERIKKCVALVRTIHHEPKPTSFFKKDLQFESIDVVDLLFELEQEFKIPFTMNEFNNYILAELRNPSWDFTMEQLADFAKGKLP